MKTITITDLKQKLSAGFIEKLNGDICTITKNGRICGAVIDMTGRDDIEEFLLRNDRTFVELVRKSATSGPPIPMEDVERRLRIRERADARKKRRKAA